MKGANHKQILGRRNPLEFVGRDDVLQDLIGLSYGDRGGRLMLHAPRSGATEVLLQTYDTLFSQRSDVFPIYFSFSDRDIDPAAAGRRFVREFLSQFVAFRRQDTGLIFTSPSLRELSGLLPAGDAQAMDDIIRELTGEAGHVDHIESLTRSFSLPLRAAYRGLRPFVMIDSAHEASFADYGDELLSELASAYSKGGFPFVFASRRRHTTSFHRLTKLPLEPLSPSDTEELIDAAALVKNVELSTATRDLIAMKCGSDLAVIHSIISAAAVRGQSLVTHRSFARIYTDEIFGGAVAELFDRELDAATPSSETERILIGILNDLYEDNGRAVTTNVIKNRLGIKDAELERLLKHLDLSELVSVASGKVTAVLSNRPFVDHLKIRFKLEISNENRTSVYADLLTRVLDEAPREMAESYRRNSSLDLRSLMEQFDAREVPAALLDYGKFKYELKGLAAEEVSEKLRTSADKFGLPQIVFSAPTESFYKAIGLLTEAERSAVAIGFEGDGSGSKQRIAWIAVEVDSKLEATADDAEFWCDRLEMAALMCGFERYRIWLVSPEGFDEEALAVIADRDGIGSSRQQIKLLYELFAADSGQIANNAAETYEIVIPMVDDAEMVAARTLEEIAKRHNISARDINHLKTALVEACINAAEHSHSPDRKIYQKFAITDDSITITVANRGIRLTDNGGKGGTLGEGKRGWGLQLIKKMMDEVKVENVDDGTKILMTKYLRTEE